MTRFSDRPVEKKLLLATLSICGAVLLLAAAVLFLFQAFMFRSNFQRDTATLASIIAKNTTAALAFGDRSAADEILASLKARPSVESAVLVAHDGGGFARFGSAPDFADLATFPPPGGWRFSGRDLLCTQPVELDGKPLGVLYLRCDYSHTLMRLMALSTTAMLGVVLLSAVLASWLSGRLCRFIVDPILSLAATARSVGEKNDYTVRSALAGRSDELGTLAGAFNHMLSRIQEQDAALSVSQQKLEAMVNSIDGIVWDWNPRTNEFTYVSCQAERILGFPPDKWVLKPHFWESMVHPEDLPRAMADYKKALEARAPYSYEYRVIAADGRTVWIRENGVILVENHEAAAIRGIFLDVTRQKLAEADLQELNRRLIEASRQAGKAEVATGVLHNVGNVLNSVNVSCTLLREKIAQSELPTLEKTAALLNQHSEDAASFLASDPKGRLLPRFVGQVASQLRREQREFAAELDHLASNIEHIKGIVAMQQEHAGAAPVLEPVTIPDLVEDALKMVPDLASNGIEIVRDFAPVPQASLDKHKALQILVNLIRNARQAISESRTSPQRISLVIRPGLPGRLTIAVHDTGVGIRADHLNRIFSHGFTTRSDGHGFGLHIGALHAMEMGGSLSAESAGPGCGATFTLELPLGNNHTTQ